MDVLNHRFLYFIDAADGRGTVLYLRHDGDTGWSNPRRQRRTSGLTKHQGGTFDADG